jgi:hypothetical protein
MAAGGMAAAAVIMEGREGEAAVITNNRPSLLPWSLP